MELSLQLSLLFYAIASIKRKFFLKFTLFNTFYTSAENETDSRNLLSEPKWSAEYQQIPE